MKAIAIIDMPKRCVDCQWFDYSHYCQLNGHEMTANEFDDISTVKRPKWCPLKPIPKREKANKGSSCEFKIIDEAWTQGFNDCLAEITGEME